MNARSWLAGAAALVALVVGSLLLPEPPSVAATGAGTGSAPAASTGR